MDQPPARSRELGEGQTAISAPAFSACRPRQALRAGVSGPQRFAAGHGGPSTTPRDWNVPRESLLSQPSRDDPDRETSGVSGPDGWRADGCFGRRWQAAPNPCHRPRHRVFHPCETGAGLVRQAAERAAAHGRIKRGNPPPCEVRQCALQWRRFSGGSMPCSPACI